jgi:2-keto-4-pentenoate hydratase/2-oxohepta-3-ene-1,7-dioic acid hydratase in catechol pathway
MKTVRFKDGGASLSVGKILCLGRNYPEHVKEMRAEAPPVPVVFLKPPTALLEQGGTIVTPPFSHVLHHEVEMVVVVGKEGKNISRETAMDYVAGYAVGLDMTLRDVQTDAKKKGLPWSVAKGFDTSAPLSDAVRRDAVPDPHMLNITLRVNGDLRQSSNTRNMIFSVPVIIAYLSSVFSLEAGDLIFTGTPEGVGPVTRGDTLTAELESVATLTVGVQ